MAEGVAPPAPGPSPARCFALAAISHSSRALRVISLACCAAAVFCWELVDAVDATGFTAEVGLAVACADTPATVLLVLVTADDEPGRWTLSAAVCPGEVLGAADRGTLPAALGGNAAVLCVTPIVERGNAVPELPRTAALEEFSGTAILGGFPGAAALGGFLGTAFLGELPGAAVLGGFPGTAALRGFPDTAVLGEFPGTVALGRLPRAADLGRFP